MILAAHRVAVRSLAPLIRPACVQGYNGLVADPPKQTTPQAGHPHHHAYATETTGLLLVAVLLLILTLIRYWHFINWSIH
jgi:hypothetical protein